MAQGKVLIRESAAVDALAARAVAGGEVAPLAHKLRGRRMKGASEVCMRVPQGFDSRAGTAQTSYGVRNPASVSAKTRRVLTEGIILWKRESLKP